MSSIEKELEEERSIINAATAGPWEWRDDQYPGQLVRRVYLGDATSDDWMERGEVHPLNVLKCGDWLPTEGDAAFITHARTALERRNEQIDAVLVKCVELEETDNAVARAFAEEFRRAIEEAS